MAELGREFPEVKNEGYDYKKTIKRYKKINFQIPNRIKRKMNQIQGCWRRLKLKSKKDHVTICNVMKQEKLVRR